MTETAKVAEQASLDTARQLVAELEAGNEEAANELLEQLSRQREQGLFQELGKLTRELHNALSSFQLDSRIASLTESDIPDAKERLNYVITMTEQAAHKTLTAVETSLPVAEELQRDARELHDKWQRFRRRDMIAEEFRELVPELDRFLANTVDHASLLNSQLSDVLMAQDFQDLTGQIIRRVISLVQEVEENLVDLIRISGQQIKGGKVVDRPAQPVKAVEGESSSKGFGPQVPGVKEGDGEVMSGQDDVDELLSSLGF